MLGTNGGGFFNVNAAHPFENPTAIANFLQMLSIFALGAALTNVFGRMVGNERQGWAILAAMGVLFLAGVTVAYWAEAAGNPLVHALGDRRRQHGGQGGPLRHRDVERSSPSSPPPPPAARSTPCTTASPRSGA